MRSKEEVGRQKSGVGIDPPASRCNATQQREPSPFFKRGLRGIFVSIAAVVYGLLFSGNALADDLNLQDLIDEALKNNHEILMFESRQSASRFKIPQEGTLPDPMFMFGYLNEGVKDPYTFGDEEAADSQWMFSLSQMFPYPGKLSLKSEMALRDTESLQASSASVRLKVAARVKELYYELLLAYAEIDLTNNMSLLFSRIEEAALARYSTGMAPQQEVLMAQTEKYMLLEKEEMLKQKVQSVEAMLNSTAGRDVNSPLGRPVEIPPSEFNYEMNELIRAAYENSPDIQSKKKMIAGAETKVRMAEREYYPDFTVNASYFAKSKFFDDMWSLTTSINIPLFYKTKQSQAVYEAEASLEETRHELDDVRFMLSTSIRDNYSMLRTSEKLMDLYTDGLIPKTYQNFESAIAGYTTGKVEAITAITALKSLIDYKLLYRKQFTEREKAIARLEALTAVKVEGQGAGVKK
ncbi:MAG: TolC family protein [Nitrospirae bacterium]|nr:TolC family protein [Nitrospirota bacterium]